MRSFLNVFSIQQNGEVNLNFEKEPEIPHCVRKNIMKKSFIMGNFLSAFLSNNMGKWSRSFKKTERTYFFRFLKFPILQGFNNFM